MTHSLSLPHYSLTPSAHTTHTWAQPITLWCLHGATFTKVLAEKKIKWNCENTEWGSIHCNGSQWIRLWYSMFPVSSFCSTTANMAKLKRMYMCMYALTCTYTFTRHKVLTSPTGNLQTLQIETCDLKIKTKMLEKAADKSTNAWKCQNFLCVLCIQFPLS